MNYVTTIAERAEKKMNAAAAWRARHQGLAAVDVEGLTQEVCAKHGVSRAAVHNADRRRQVVSCRNEIFYRLNKAGWSFPRIGGYFGKDHSSVLHAVRKYEKARRLAQAVRVEIKEAIAQPVTIASAGGFKIERGIPLPTHLYGKGGRAAKYPFGRMEVGDSFLAIGVTKTRVTSAASYYGKRNGLKFSVRKDGEWYRVWRTA